MTIINILWWKNPSVDSETPESFRAIRDSDFYFINRPVSKGIACVKDKWLLFRDDNTFSQFKDLDDALPSIKEKIEAYVKNLPLDDRFKIALEAGQLSYKVQTLEQAIKEKR